MLRPSERDSGAHKQKTMLSRLSSMPDIIDILKRLEFRNSFGILRLDKHCRDYFITTIQARHSAK